jgi:hypothetical protein
MGRRSLVVNAGCRTLRSNPNHVLVTCETYAHFLVRYERLSLFPHIMFIVLMNVPPQRLILEFGMTSSSHPGPRKNQSSESAAFFSLAAFAVPFTILSTMSSTIPSTMHFTMPPALPFIASSLSQPLSRHRTTLAMTRQERQIKPPRLRSSRTHQNHPPNLPQIPRESIIFRKRVALPGIRILRQHESSLLQSAQMLDFSVPARRYQVFQSEAFLPDSGGAAQG